MRVLRMPTLCHSASAKFFHSAHEPPRFVSASGERHVRFPRLTTRISVRCMTSDRTPESSS